MRTLGLLGGMAWPSTADAYRVINEEVGRRLGGHRSAPLLVWSFDFAEVEALQAAGDWDGAGSLLGEAASRLQRAGADGLLLCTNTMHRVAEAIEAAVDIPLLHIADATAAAVLADGLDRVGLLGTRFTVEEPFLADRFAVHGIDVIVPTGDDVDLVHRVIYDELVHGQVVDASRDAYRRVVTDLVERGAQGVVLGCPEIELLLGPGDVPVPSYPTARLQALHAVDWLLHGGPA